MYAISSAAVHPASRMCAPAMEMVLKRGVSRLPNRIVSEISRIDGRTGKIHVPRATYSFRMSFWIVPVSLLRGTPVRSAHAMYIA